MDSQPVSAAAQSVIRTKRLAAQKSAIEQRKAQDKRAHNPNAPTGTRATNITPQKKESTNQASATPSTATNTNRYRATTFGNVAKHTSTKRMTPLEAARRTQRKETEEKLLKEREEYLKKSFGSALKTPPQQSRLWGERLNLQMSGLNEDPYARYDIKRNLQEVDYALRGINRDTVRKAIGQFENTRGAQLRKQLEANARRAFRQQVTAGATRHMMQRAPGYNRDGVKGDVPKQLKQLREYADEKKDTIEKKYTPDDTENKNKELQALEKEKKKVFLQITGRDKKKTGGKVKTLSAGDFVKMKATKSKKKGFMQSIFDFPRDVGQAVGNSIRETDLYKKGEKLKKEYDGLTPDEKEFVWDNPFSALKAKDIKVEAESMAKRQFPTISQHNTKADAYRHAYLAIELTRQIGRSATLDLLLSHENDTTLPLDERMMDMHNNLTAVQMAVDPKNKNKTTEELALQALKDNVLIILEK